MSTIFNSEDSSCIFKRAVTQQSNEVQRKTGKSAIVIVFCGRSNKDAWNMVEMEYEQAQYSKAKQTFSL